MSDTLLYLFFIDCEGSMSTFPIKGPMEKPIQVLKGGLFTFDLSPSLQLHAKRKPHKKH